MRPAVFPVPSSKRIIENMNKNDETKQHKEAKGNLFKFMLQNSKGQVKWFVLAVVAATISIIAGFFMPQVIRFTVDSVIGDKPSELPLFMNNWLAAMGGREALRTNLIWCGVAVLFFSMLGAGFNFISRMGMATGTERFSQNLRNRLFRHVQHLPFKWHVQNQTGDVIQRCTSDLDVMKNFVGSQLLEVVRTVILVSIALWLMFSMNTALALVALLFIPLILAYSIIFYIIIGKRFLQADEAEGELTVAVQENLTGVRVVRAFGREKFEVERFDGFNNAFANLWVKLGHTLSIYWGLGDVATGLQILSVVLVGGIMAANGTISLGEYLVFAAYNQQLAWPVRALGRVLSEMSKTGVSAGRLQEILDAEEEKPEPNAKKPPLDVDIRFENVSFSYDNQPVLKNLSFTIPRGKTFGILGATGSGKSTITYLLNRLYDLPEDGGKIYFGDTEISEIDRGYLRRNMGLVLQEPFLFSKTIEENIAITLPGEPDRPRIRRSAAIAAVDEAISDFTSGYETVVGERGVTLSGGQKQRVAIARTLMLEAPVMIFDDSMSAVDLETDAQIRAALRESTSTATVVLISHRINTLMQADRILVLEEGSLADIGTHAELIHRPGLYKRIYDMQSEAAESTGEALPAAADEGGVPQ